jgi:hypothetical protein
LASPQTKAASTHAETAGESMQNKAIDIIRESDPAKAEAYLKVNTNPWTNGVPDIKTIELICVGLNAACTNLQPERAVTSGPRCKRAPPNTRSSW